MPITCTNCDTEFEGRFCPQCGQKASTGRLTVGHVLHEGWHGVTHTDKSFLSLLWMLLTKPGTVIREFIEGRRKKYFNPYMFFVVVTGLLIFVTRKVYGYEDALYKYNNEWGQEINKEYELLVLFSIPVIALLIRLVFLRWKYNYAEWVTVLVFAFGLINVIDIPIQALYLVFIKYHRSWSSFTSYIDYGVLVYVLIAVVRPEKWWRWLQIVVGVILVYLVLNYIAVPVALLLMGVPWEDVQYSF